MVIVAGFFIDGRGCRMRAGGVVFLIPAVVGGVCSLQAGLEGRYGAGVSVPAARLLRGFDMLWVVLKRESVICVLRAGLRTLHFFISLVVEFVVCLGGEGKVVGSFVMFGKWSFVVRTRDIAMVSKVQYAVDGETCCRGEEDAAEGHAVSLVLRVGRVIE